MPFPLATLTHADRFAARHIGPTPEGEFPPEAMDRLRDIGKWMAVNGESIYGTQAGPFVENGGIQWPDGRLPVNTHGGNLSDVYLLGMTHIIEAVDQLRGTSTCQVEGAELAAPLARDVHAPVAKRAPLLVGLGDLGRERDDAFEP